MFYYKHRLNEEAKKYQPAQPQPEAIREGADTVVGKIRFGRVDQRQFKGWTIDTPLGRLGVVEESMRKNTTSSWGPTYKVYETYGNGQDEKLVLNLWTSKFPPSSVEEGGVKNLVYGGGPSVALKMVAQWVMQNYPAWVQESAEVTEAMARVQLNPAKKIGHTVIDAGERMAKIPFDKIMPLRVGANYKIGELFVTVKGNGNKFVAGDYSTGGINYPVEFKHPRNASKIVKGNLSMYPMGEFYLSILSGVRIMRGDAGFGTAKPTSDYSRFLSMAESVEVTEEFKAGDKVKVPHKGKMVSGKIVRYDDGGTDKARQHGGGYLVDVGEPASVLVPKQKVQKEQVDLMKGNLKTESVGAERGKTIAESDKYMSTKDIAAEIRKDLKAAFPKHRFSVRFSSYSGGSSITVGLASGPDAFHVESDGTIKYVQINRYHSTFYSNPKFIDAVMKIVTKRHWDESDSQIDYFSTNFYIHLEQGRFDKPFVLTDASGKKPVNPAQKVPTAEEVEIGDLEPISEAKTPSQLGLVKSKKVDDVIGTYRIGTIQATEANLSLVLGFASFRESDADSDGKVTVEWAFKRKTSGTNKGLVFTVYDYKNPPLSPTAMHRWSVGGTKENAAEIHKILKELGLDVRMESAEATGRSIAEGKKEAPQVHFKSYTAAVAHAREMAEKRGYEIDEDSWSSRITHGYPARPAEGNTTTKKIDLLKGGKPVKEQLYISVYGMATGFELTTYITK